MTVLLNFRDDDNKKVMLNLFQHPFLILLDPETSSG